MAIRYRSDEPKAVARPSKAAAKPEKCGRGRPSSGKEPTTIRLDADVLAKFRATGPGWQSRINGALREFLGI